MSVARVFSEKELTMDPPSGSDGLDAQPGIVSPTLRLFRSCESAGEVSIAAIGNSDATCVILRHARLTRSSIAHDPVQLECQPVSAFASACLGLSKRSSSHS